MGFKKGLLIFFFTEFPSCRHVISFMSFLGFFNVYALRVNLSVALVAMVNQTEESNSSVSDECPASNTNSTTVQVCYCDAIILPHCGVKYFRT